MYQVLHQALLCSAGRRVVQVEAGQPLVVYFIMLFRVLPSSPSLNPTQLFRLQNITHTHMCRRPV